MNLEQAISAIRNAASIHDAAQVRNEVATEAMHGKRPESDADACRAAFFEQWNSEILNQRVGDCGPRPGCNWRGD